MQEESVKATAAESRRTNAPKLTATPKVTATRHVASSSEESANRGSLSILSDNVRNHRAEPNEHHYPTAMRGLRCISWFCRVGYRRERYAISLAWTRLTDDNKVGETSCGASVTSRARQSVSESRLSSEIAAAAINGERLMPALQATSVRTWFSRSACRLTMADETNASSFESSSDIGNRQ